MNTSEVEESRAKIIVKMIENLPHSVQSQTILKKTTGSNTISSFDAGDELAEHTAPYNTFIQIIEGAVEIFINDRKFKLKVGEGIIIPAHAVYNFNTTEQFKMLSTVIKSGFDD